jgi:hypothetical protein
MCSDGEASNRLLKNEWSLARVAGIEPAYDPLVRMGHQGAGLVQYTARGGNEECTFIPQRVEVSREHARNR